MIRPFTIVCMVSAFGAGLYLYQSKHQSQLLDREITRTVKQTEVARERTGMLRAEWALLNEPDRLAELARAHTTLQTLKPTQFVALNDLSSHLGAPVTPGQPAAPVEAQPEDLTPVAQATPPAAAEPKPDTKTEPKPVATADARIATPRHAAKPPNARPEPSATAPVQLAAAPGHFQPRYASSAVNSDAVAPGTVGAAVLRAMRVQTQAHNQARAYVQPAAASAPVYAARAYVAPAYVAPASSVLGGSRALPPPVPFAAR